MSISKKNPIVSVFTSVCMMVTLIALFSASAWAQTDEKAAEEVMARARAQWAAEIAGTAATDHLAEEYTQFVPGVPVLMDGKKFITPFYEISISNGDKLVAADMANPKVQVYGNVAILSYNFVGTIKHQDGTIEPQLAKSTRVYVKKGGKWMLVHANFAPVD